MGRVILDRVYDEYGVTRANLTGVTWAFWSPGNAVDGSAPVDSGVDGATDASGMMVITTSVDGMGDLALTDGTNFGLYADVIAFSEGDNYPNDPYSGWTYDGTKWTAINLRNGNALEIRRVDPPTLGPDGNYVRWIGYVDAVEQTPPDSWPLRSWYGMQSFLKRNGLQ